VWADLNTKLKQKKGNQSKGGGKILGNWGRVVMGALWDHKSPSSLPTGTRGLTEWAVYVNTGGGTMDNTGKTPLAGVMIVFEKGSIFKKNP